MTADEFRNILRDSPDVNEIVSNYIVSEGPGAYVNQAAIDYVAAQARSKFQMKDTDPLKIIVVGSAKLGFSISETLDPPKPRYRDYRPGKSDIDVAIVSPVIYGKIWSSLARYGADQRKFPWENELSAYMFHGWIRPDKFPSSELPQQCKDWNSFWYTLNSSSYFRFKRIRCALYQSTYFLRLYHERSVRDAINAEEQI